MLLRVELHPGLLVGVSFRYSHHTAAYRGRGGLDEYQSAPPQRGHGGHVKNPKSRGLAARGARGR
jgi:hypothetical protein